MPPRSRTLEPGRRGGPARTRRSRSPGPRQTGRPRMASDRCRRRCHQQPSLPPGGSRQPPLSPRRRFQGHSRQQLPLLWRDLLRRCSRAHVLPARRRHMPPVPRRRGLPDPPCHLFLLLVAALWQEVKPDGSLVDTGIRPGCKTRRHAYATIRLLTCPDRPLSVRHTLPRRQHRPCQPIWRQ